MNNERDMEQKIMEAAEELALSHGFDATSTTEIARKVGCNQALVHYYFRTKENLFQKIFEKNVGNILSVVSNYQYNGDFNKLINDWIEAYFNAVSRKRRVPFFIIKETLMNDSRRAYVREYIVGNQQHHAIFVQFDKIVQDEVRAGRIRQITTFDLILNVISLIVFSFIALPMYTEWMLKDEQGVEDFLAQRKEEVKEVITRSLLP